MNDRLALPLLMDLCDKGGLNLPPCFMSLPMELKLLIFEYLPGDFGQSVLYLFKIAIPCLK